jgi:hypothetical protein
LHSARRRRRSSPRHRRRARQISDALAENDRHRRFRRRHISVLPSAPPARAKADLARASRELGAQVTLEHSVGLAHHSSVAGTGSACASRERRHCATSITA